MNTAAFQLDPGFATGGRSMFRVPRGIPRFHSDHSYDRNAVRGCPAEAVPADHVARVVRDYLRSVDFSVQELAHSALGRKPVHPRFKAGALLYGSLVGLHHASEVARATETDLAMRLVSGGNALSAETLKLYRRENADFFKSLLARTVKDAAVLGLVNAQDLATDGVRLRADASLKSMRTLSRSQRRLEELQQVDTSGMSEAAKAKHDAKVAKHQAAVARCEQEGRTSHSITDPAAALMKFPNGAALPGHRITATTAGVEERIVIDVIIDNAPVDFGHLEQACESAREALLAAGFEAKEGAPAMQVAADPGYLSEADLRYADENRNRVDVVIHQPAAPERKNENGEAKFDRSRFEIRPDGTAVCPAGTPMEGPKKLDQHRRAWKGVGCATCPMQAKCTSAQRRTLTQDQETDRLHGSMAARMAQEGAAARYNRRMCTVEPVFSYTEDVMRFVRSSSRLQATVRSEIYMNFAAYNIVRLAKLKKGRILRVYVTLWYPLRGVAGASQRHESSKRRS